jgi:Protein of unknown function with HXXEE motif
MSPRARAAFLGLVLVQAGHSVEEYRSRLYEVLAPARYVSGLISPDRRVGFVIFNSALVAFGLWCAAVPIRREWPAARGLAWGWAILEAANGTVHVAWALSAGAYRPGLYTAPLLIAAALFLAAQLRGPRRRMVT